MWNSSIYQGISHTTIFFFVKWNNMVLHGMYMICVKKDAVNSLWSHYVYPNNVQFFYYFGPRPSKNTLFSSLSCLINLSISDCVIFSLYLNRIPCFDYVSEFTNVDKQDEKNNENKQANFNLKIKHKSPSIIEVKHKIVSDCC